LGQLVGSTGATEIMIEAHTITMHMHFNLRNSLVCLACILHIDINIDMRLSSAFRSMKLRPHSTRPFGIWDLGFGVLVSGYLVLCVSWLLILGC